MNATVTQSLQSRVEALGHKHEWQLALRELEAAGRDALPAVLEGMKHPDWRVRRWCVAFLDHHADEACVLALVAALRDESSVVRRHAVHSLGCQRCKAVPLNMDLVALIIERALHDESVRVRQVAAHMLGNQAYDARIVAALEEILTTQRDEKLRSNAMWALEKQTGSR